MKRIAPVALMFLAIFALGLLLIGRAHGQTTATPPLAPGSPIALKWSPSTSCAATGVTCYGTVYRSLANCATVAACAWTPLTTASAPAPVAGPYTDSTVPTTATVASYYVTNTATGGGWTNQESTASNIAVVTFQQAPPAAPTGLSAN